MSFDRKFAINEGMFLSLVMFALIIAGGTAITYLYEKEDSLMPRLGAGSVVGSAIFGTVGFLLACFIGLSTATVIVSLAIAALPAALFFVRPDIKQAFVLDWRKARSRTHGTSLSKLFRAIYYVFFFVLFALYFDRAMIDRPDAILTGGSQNLGDLPFHLGAIFSFTEANNFPPQNPSFAGAKFTYPFLADLIVAFFVKVGVTVRTAMFVQNVILAFSLVLLLEKFTARVAGDKFAGKIAPLLLFFSGGLGFIWFFRDYWQGAMGFFDILMKLPKDYTIDDNFRWGNSLVVLFLTQRGLLFGLPLTLIVLTGIWDLFSSPKNDDETPVAETFLHDSNRRMLVLGLLAGLLPLIHVHSLAALFVVCAWLFFFRLDRWKTWLIFGGAVAALAVPELLWSLRGSASNLSQFIEPFFGWDARKQNFFVFWAKNIGFFAPALVFGLYLVMRKSKTETKSERLLIFYLPFAFLFVVSNTFKLAPWEWDNIKILIYWFVGSLPFAAVALVWLWEKSSAIKSIAVAALLALTMAGALDVWRTVSRQINYEVFSRDAIKIAELVKLRTPPDAKFLNAPTYNSAVVLTGRQSLMRYSGHLSSYGIDYGPREDDVKRIYQGTALADRLLQQNKIDYVIVSPEEMANLDVREEFFYKYQIVAEVGAYKVFRVK